MSALHQVREATAGQHWLAVFLEQRQCRRLAVWNGLFCGVFSQMCQPVAEIRAFAPTRLDGAPKSRQVVTHRTESGPY